MNHCCHNRRVCDNYNRRVCSLKTFSQPKGMWNIQPKGMYIETDNPQPKGMWITDVLTWRVFFRIYRCDPTNNSDLSDGWAMDKRWITLLMWQLANLPMCNQMDWNLEVFFRIYRCEPTNNSDLSDGWVMDERWISDGWAMVNTVDVTTCHRVV